MPLAPLATVDDIAVRLGRDLTGSEETRVVPLLQDASAQVRRVLPADFLLHAGDTQVLRGYDSEIHLPDMTTTAVSSVVAIGSPGFLPDFPIPWFIWDGLDKIRIDPGQWLINMPEIWWDDGDVYPGTYRVTRDYGYPEVPDDVIAVVAVAVIGVLTSPTEAAGLIGESIGPYSYRLERGGGGAGVALTQADLASLADYRATAGTIQTRLR